MYTVAHTAVWLCQHSTFVLLMLLLLPGGADAVGHITRLCAALMLIRSCVCLWRSGDVQRNEISERWKLHLSWASCSNINVLSHRVGDAWCVWVLLCFTHSTPPLSLSLALSLSQLSVSLCSKFLINSGTHMIIIEPFLFGSY